jgi:hypothetical protein
MAALISSPCPSPSSTEDKPFRFLDLPIELRCMVYEEIEMSTSHYRLKDPTITDASEEQTTPASYMTLLVKSLPVSILATCQTINKEEAALLAPKLETLRNEPSHFIVDSTSFSTLSGSYLCIGSMIEEHERDQTTAQWFGPGGCMDPEAWNPRWFAISDLDQISHVFLRDSNEYAAIVAFYRKCLYARKHRHTTKTVITVCFRDHIGPREGFPLEFDMNPWLIDRARDGFELQLSGFSAENVVKAINDFAMAKAYNLFDRHWRIREISDAEWKTVSARDEVVSFEGEGAAGLKKLTYELILSIHR